MQLARKFMKYQGTRSLSIFGQQSFEHFETLDRMVLQISSQEGDDDGFEALPDSDWEGKICITDDNVGQYGQLPTDCTYLVISDFEVNCRTAVQTINCHSSTRLSAWPKSFNVKLPFSPRAS